MSLRKGKRTASGRVVESKKVICSRCGRELVGIEGINPRNLTVRKHKRPDGFNCGGHLYRDHGLKATP